jgi:hypothetical protein
MTAKPILVDAHADIAYNMLNYGRDYTRPVAETRRLESGGYVVQENGDALISWDEYQRGRVAVIFGCLSPDAGFDAGQIPHPSLKTGLGDSS